LVNVTCSPSSAGPAGAGGDVVVAAALDPGDVGAVVVPGIVVVVAAVVFTAVGATGRSGASRPQPASTSPRATRAAADRLIRCS
jgi:hypothetical protein